LEYLFPVGANRRIKYKNMRGFDVKVFSIYWYNIAIYYSSSDVILYLQYLGGYTSRQQWSQHPVLAALTLGRQTLKYDTFK